jgi:hypothetical protein
MPLSTNFFDDCSWLKLFTRKNFVKKNIHKCIFNIHGVRVRAMVFNTTFNNFSVIMWWSVLLVEKTGVPGENYQPAASH